MPKKKQKRNKTRKQVAASVKEGLYAIEKDCERTKKERNRRKILNQFDNFLDNDGPTAPIGRMWDD